VEDLRSFWPFRDVPSYDISIYDGPDVFAQDFAQASRAQQIALAGFWFQAEVLNGGLEQFFSNDTGVLAPEAAAVCLELGLPKLAASLEQAMAWFGQPYPREREVREEALEAFARLHPATDPFEALDEIVATHIYPEGPGLGQAALSYFDRIAN